jgi:hypothetical protein
MLNVIVNMGSLIGMSIVIPIIGLCCCISLPCYLVSSLICSIKLKEKKGEKTKEKSEEGFVVRSNRFLDQNINPLLIIILGILILFFIFVDSINLNLNSYYKHFKKVLSIKI